MLVVLLLLPAASAVSYIEVYPMKYTQEHNDSETSTTAGYGADVQVSNITSMYRNISGQIYFSIEMRTTQEGDATRIRVYKNGIGSSLCLLQTGSTTYETKQCTLPNGVYNSTDYLRITGASFTGGVTSWFKNASLNYNSEPVLLTPLNNSYDYFSFPDMTHDVNFSWLDVTSYGFHIVIAQDENFNSLSVDKIITTNYTTESLPSATYWWKVRLYNLTSEQYGNYSNVSKLYLVRNASSSGITGVEGLVYELSDSTSIPLSHATVYIRKETLDWSDNVVTGSNGYYLFDNLTNSTVYSISAKAEGYDDSVTEYITTIPGQRLIKSIMLTKCISGFNCGFLTQPVTFTVRNLFDQEFSGVAVKVYKGDELTAYDTGITDSGGSVTFMLTKDVKYRVTFTGGGIDGTLTYYAYGSNTNYRILVVSGFPTGGNRYDYISANLTSTTINTTHSNLSLIYSDSIHSTSFINFYATNLTSGVTCYSNSTGEQNVTLSCDVLSSGTYRYGFVAVSSIYGTIRQDKTKNFAIATSAGNPLAGKVDATLLQWGSIMLIVFVAAMFSIRTVKFGAILVPAMALVFWSLHWLQVNFLLLATAMCIGVMVYMRMSEHKVEY